MRKVYRDFIRQRIAGGDVGWLARRAWQYLLISLSIMHKRPLCGPILGTLIPSYRCNYKCLMCEIADRQKALAGKGLKLLSHEELRTVVKDFGLLGISGIGFTGGEPLLYEGIFDLIRLTRERGMIAHLNTNGSLLTSAVAARLLASGTDSINISLDGSRADIHDRIRGIPGAFEHTMRAIRAVNEVRKDRPAAMRLKTVAVLSRENIDDVPHILELTRASGVDCVEFIPEQIFYTAAGADRHYDDDFFTRLSRAIDSIHSAAERGMKIENSPQHLSLFEDSFRRNASPLSCFAAFNSLGVDSFGEIYPCVPWMNWGKSVGNIRSIPLPRFWYSKDYNARRPEVLRCRDCFLNCQVELNLLFHPKKIKA